MSPCVLAVVSCLSFLAVISGSLLLQAFMLSRESLQLLVPHYGFHDVAVTNADAGLSAVVDARVVDGALADAGIPAVTGFIHLILQTCLPS